MQAASKLFSGRHQSSVSFPCARGQPQQHDVLKLAFEPQLPVLQRASLLCSLPSGFLSFLESLLDVVKTSDKAFWRKGRTLERKVSDSLRGPLFSFLACARASKQRPNRSNSCPTQHLFFPRGAAAFGFAATEKSPGSTQGGGYPLSFARRSAGSFHGSWTASSVTELSSGSHLRR